MFGSDFTLLQKKIEVDSNQAVIQNAGKLFNVDFVSQYYRLWKKLIEVDPQRAALWLKKIKYI